MENKIQMSSEVKICSGMFPPDLLPSEDGMVSYFVVKGEEDSNGFRRYWSFWVSGGRMDGTFCFGNLKGDIEKSTAQFKVSIYETESGEGGMNNSFRKVEK